MHVRSISFSHFRGIQALDLPLNERLTLLTGPNGSGKSTVLDGLAMSLSWAVARIRNHRGNGQGFNSKGLDHHNGSKTAAIELELHDFTQEFRWKLASSREAKSPVKSDLKALMTYAEMITERPGDTRPLFLYYPVHRAVLDIPLRIRDHFIFEQDNAYDDALTGAANFRRFFDWFRNREDLENEQRLAAGLRDTQLTAVRSALESFLPGFSEFTIRRNPLRFTVKKAGKELRVDHLSDGEKTMIAMIGDMARRLAMANPGLENPLEGEAVVLIDEIDLHLHPEWQRRIVGQLVEAFPHCQFILSTHSPQVLGEVDPNQIRQLSLTSNTISFSIPQQSFGLTSNQIIDEVMNASSTPLSRNQEIAQRVQEVFDLIEDDAFEQAKVKIQALRERLNGDIPELIEAEATMQLYRDDA